MEQSNKFKLAGKSISILGVPAAGKTFLAERLSKFLDSKLLLESPNATYPKEIKTSLTSLYGDYMTMLWFRNFQITSHLRAASLAKSGKTIIYDSSFLTYQIYADLYAVDDFSREVLKQLLEIDIKIIKPLDFTIYLKTSDEDIERNYQLRQGIFDWENDKWFTYIKPLPRMMDRIINLASSMPGFIIVDHNDFDFAIDSDVIRLIDLLAMHTT